MRVLAVMVGAAERLAGKSGKTGINKRPVTGPVMVGPPGLAGDAICDLVHHGGVDQAVYLFTRPDYDWWERDLRRPLAPGTFGENLLLDGLESAELAVGDRLAIGPALLEVTSPRIPCGTLNHRMGDKGFGKRFMAACRSGIYARVLVPGSVAAGDGVELTRFDGPKLTLRELFDLYPHKTPTPEFVARCLAAPVHHKLRAQLLIGQGVRA